MQIEPRKMGGMLLMKNTLKAFQLIFEVVWKSWGEKLYVGILVTTTRFGYNSNLEESDCIFLFSPKNISNTLYSKLSIKNAPLMSVP